MKLILSPIASDRTTTVSVNGLIITVDGQDYDLSVIPEGGQADGEAPFIGTVTRDEVTIQYHYDSVAAEDDQPKDWDNYTYSNPQGDIASPIVWKPEPEEVQEDEL